MRSGDPAARIIGRGLMRLRPQQQRELDLELVLHADRSSEPAERLDPELGLFHACAPADAPRVRVPLRLEYDIRGDGPPAQREGALKRSPNVLAPVARSAVERHVLRPELDLRMVRGVEHLRAGGLGVDLAAVALGETRLPVVQ